MELPKIYSVKTEYAKTQDGTILHIDSPLTQTVSKMVCLCCENPVFPRRGTYTPHFVHNSLRHCSNESVIHIVAKQTLAEFFNNKKSLPISVSCSDCKKILTYSLYDYLPAGIAYNEISLNPQVRVDVGITDDNRFLGALEVCVSNPVDKAKAKLLNPYPWLEIDGQTFINWLKQGGPLTWKSGSILKQIPRTCPECLQKYEEKIKSRIIREQQEQYYEERHDELSTAFISALSQLLKSNLALGFNLLSTADSIIISYLSQTLVLFLGNTDKGFNISFRSSPYYQDTELECGAKIGIQLPKDVKQGLKSTTPITELLSLLPLNEYSKKLSKEISIFMAQNHHNQYVITYLSNHGFKFEGFHVFTGNDEPVNNLIIGKGWNLYFSKQNFTFMVYVNNFNKKYTIKRRDLHSNQQCDNLYRIVGYFNWLIDKVAYQMSWREKRYGQ